MDQQCCPGGNCPETLRRGSPDILAKITGKSRENFQKKIFFAFFLTILSGFASDLAKKSGDPPRRVSGGSPGGLRTISAGTTLLVHTVHFYFLNFCILTQGTNLTKYDFMQHVRGTLGQFRVHLLFFHYIKVRQTV